MSERRIGFVGCGNMANAIIRGALASGALQPGRVRISDVSKDLLARRGREHGITTAASNRELVEWADIIVFAVKPQVVTAVLDDCADAVSSDSLVISIAAGVPARAFESKLAPGARVVRVMPNTPALALAGATAIAAGANATEDDMAVTKALFDSVGRTVILDESHIDAVTGLSGSGPAYVMLVIEALADGGVKVGLPRDTALLLAAQTVYGSAKLLLELGEHPGRLKDMVTSPGGTTIAGVHALERAGLRRALMDAVEVATERSRELGAPLRDRHERLETGKKD